MASSVTQQVDFCTDTLSVSTNGGVNKCGNRNYKITSVPTSPAVALSTLSELTVGFSTGVISLYTSNSNTVGTHTATIEVSLAWIPSKTIILPTFTITISPCVVTSV